MNKKNAIIIGAGPAGLTLALELLKSSDIKPIIIEELEQVGGISRTIRHNGNRIDIGGHRFFSKSDWVMNWWNSIMPTAPKADDQTESEIPTENLYLLVRNRLSRIFYLRRFFDYPISLSVKTISNLGIWRTVKIGLSYLKACLIKVRPEKNLEDFFINRFGSSLYRTFFKDYTEKVWGVPCDQISAEWGAQRIKGLSITKAIIHAIKSKIGSKDKSVAQKTIETSLIEHFLYPKLGPGQLWEEVCRQVLSQGGEIHLGQKVNNINIKNNAITSVESIDIYGKKHIHEGEWFASSMPIKDLYSSFSIKRDDTPHRIATNLQYRDFITIGLLVKKLSKQQSSSGKNNLLPDTWIYIQEPDVKIGRLQIFNNWSPALVSTPEYIWLGLEYFCQEGDELWSLTDDELIQLGANELYKIGIIPEATYEDAIASRIKKAYPAYFGTYEQFELVKDDLSSIKNLAPIGRNGMHRYNNQDHSMLSAAVAAKGMSNGKIDFAELWSINAEQNYHESKNN